MFKVVDLIKHYFSFNLKACMEYRAAFIGQFFAVFVNNGTFIIFWYLIYNRVGGDINGYSFNDIVMLWAIIASAFGLSEVIFGNSSKISSIIFSGELDVYILQPKPILINLVSSRMVMLGWGDILYGFIVFFIVFGLDPVRLLLFILFTITSALVFTSFRIIIHSFTFFIGNNEALAFTLENTLITAGTYPSTIFKGPVIMLLYTVIPAGFMAFLPVEIISEFNIIKLAILLIGDGIFISLSVLFFYKGIKKYESGNMIGARI